MKKNKKPFDSKTAKYILTIKLLSETLTYNNVTGLRGVMDKLEYVYAKQTDVIGVEFNVIE